MKPQKFLYGAVELSQDSRLELWSYFFDNFYLEDLTGWTDYKKYCHHMTIGHINDIKPGTYEWIMEHEGETFDITVIGIGYSDKVCAMQVLCDAISDKAIKHITVATNKSTHGKPNDSNKIENWFTLSEPIKVKGIVKIYYQD